MLRRNDSQQRRRRNSIAKQPPRPPRPSVETGRARPGDETPPELTRLFPAHDDAAKKKSKKKAPSRGAGLPDPLFRRVVMFWLG